MRSVVESEIELLIAAEEDLLRAVIVLTMVLALDRVTVDVGLADMTLLIVNKSEYDGESDHKPCGIDRRKGKLGPFPTRWSKSGELRDSHVYRLLLSSSSWNLWAFVGQGGSDTSDSRLAGAHFRDTGNPASISWLELACFLLV